MQTQELEGYQDRGGVKASHIGYWTSSTAYRDW